MKKFEKSILRDILLYCSALTYFTYLSIRYRGKYIYISGNALGDTCYTLAYSDFLQSENQCLFILNEKHREMILESYPSIKNICYYKSGSLQASLIYYLVYTKARDWYSKWNNIFILYISIKGDLTSIIYEDFHSILKKYLGLKVDTPITYPRVRLGEITAITDWNGIKNRIAVLNPYSNSMFLGGEQLWNRIASVLTERGYTIYTNVLKGQKCVNGTQPLYCSVMEFARIASEIPIIVSVRSGIIDYTVNTKSAKFVIYGDSSPIPIETMRNVYDLKTWKVSNVVECQYGSDDVVISCFNAFLDSCQVNSL